MSWYIENDRPVYVQLVEHIKQSIMLGEYQSGERLPSVRELAQTAGVNPNTMQKAFAELEREGLVYSNRTAGRFITDDENLLNRAGKEQAMQQVAQFYEKMVRMGFHLNQMTAMLAEYENNQKERKI
jgi:DNA-binding transcriptional regulator YhcF (GntR family)